MKSVLFKKGLTREEAAIAVLKIDPFYKPFMWQSSRWNDEMGDFEWDVFIKQ